MQEEKKIPEKEAKMGRSGKRVAIILAVSIAIALIAWLGVELYGQQLESSQTSSIASDQ